MSNILKVSWNFYPNTLNFTTNFRRRQTANTIITNIILYYYKNYYNVLQKNSYDGYLCDNILQ